MLTTIVRHAMHLGPKERVVKPGIPDPVQGPPPAPKKIVKGCGMCGNKKQP